MNPEAAPASVPVSEGAESGSNVGLDAIRARAAAATPGPWQWRGNVDHSDPHLAAKGRDVLGMVSRERKLTDREAKSYREWLRDLQVRDDKNDRWRHLTDEEVEERLRDEWLTDEWDTPRRDERMGFVNEHLFYDYARDMAIFEVCPEATSRDDRRVYRADIIGIRHPDAEFIAHSRQDVTDLLAALDRVLAVCDQHKHGALRWADPLPVPGWIAEVRDAVASREKVADV